jgi:hypothetical protein
VPRPASLPGLRAGRQFGAASLGPRYVVRRGRRCSTAPRLRGSVAPRRGDANFPNAHQTNIRQGIRAAGELDGADATIARPDPRSGSHDRWPDGASAGRFLCRMSSWWAFGNFARRNRDGGPNRGQPACLRPNRGQPACLRPNRGQPACLRPNRGQPACLRPNRGQPACLRPNRGQPACLRPNRGQPRRPRATTPAAPPDPPRAE